MSRMGKARVRVPERAAKGQIVEIRTMVDHPHESGFRHDNMGRLVPRHIVESFTCNYNDGCTACGCCAYGYGCSGSRITFLGYSDGCMQACPQSDAATD